MRNLAPRLLSTVMVLAALALPLLTGCSPAVRGSMALSSGDYNLALARYHEALEQDPDSVYLRLRIGLTYFTMKDYASAEATYKDILIRKPGEPNALLYLGLSRIGKGERQRALDDLTGFNWPQKFYHQKFVRAEAERLLRHPEMSADATIRCLLDALEEGRKEQDALERDMFLGLSR
ncbi:MAG TPA: tetratricopeptide repeat protein [Humidesulfovibrio sp.]|uniref:tetratricopeptide repeat protein n=1 Tax=Humidesulfovibrio sp. TaxID=2910988 RepID=UPI002B538200|nr:tetratricopeptide repeat protein [Humidesulfovibrio sp.]HWR03565.1 tetratricopeptide repeat protein [Humidesulfovibrio sp.]